MILLDQPEDELCEGRGWVETSVGEDEARDLLAPYCFDEDDKNPWRPDVGPATRVWLKPENPGPDEGLWHPAEPGEPGAVEFWEIPAS